MGKNKKKKSKIEDLELVASEDMIIDEDMCSNCRYWKGPDHGRDIQEIEDPLLVERITSDQKGVCRRFPNKETIYRESYKWCGEHYRKG